MYSVYYLLYSFHIAMLEILAVVATNVAVYWGVMPCRLLQIYRRLGRNFASTTLVYFQIIAQFLLMLLHISATSRNHLQGATSVEV